MKRLYILFIFLTFFCYSVFAETEGEKLFRENKPSDAIVALEKDILQNKVSDNTFNFLGLSFYQIGNLEKSIDAFEKGLKNEIGNKKILAFNLGNSYFGLKNYEKAIEYYSLAIESDENYAEPVLNRSNCYVNLGYYEQAVLGYEKFLQLKPDDKQNVKIKKLIDALRRKIKSLNEEKRKENMQNSQAVDEKEFELVNEQPEQLNLQEISESEASQREYEKVSEEIPSEMISDQISDDINEMNRRDSLKKAQNQSDTQEDSVLNANKDVFLGDDNILLEPENESIELENSSENDLETVEFDDLVEESLTMAVEEDEDLKQILIREEEERKNAALKKMEEAENLRLAEEAARIEAEQAEIERIRREEEIIAQKKALEEEKARVEKERMLAEEESRRVREAEDAERKLAMEKEMKRYRDEMEAEKAQLEDELRAVRKAMREAKQEREDLEEEKRLAKAEVERQKNRLEEEKRIAKEENEREKKRLENETRLAREQAEEELKLAREKALKEEQLRKEEERIAREKAAEEERIRNEKAIEEQKIAMEAEKKQLEEELKAAKKAMKQVAKEKEELEELAVAANSRAKAAELESETDFIFTSTNLYKKGNEAESITKFDVSVPMEENLESWKLEIISKANGDTSEKTIRKYDGNTVDEIKSIVWDGTSQYGSLSLGKHKAKVQLEYDDGISVSKTSQNEIYVYEEKPKVVKEVEVKINDDGTVDINIPTLSFKANSTELNDTAANKLTLTKVYEILTDKLYQKYSVVIIGYINPDGIEWTDEEKVLALGRAQEIVERFVKLGIPRERMKSEFGSGKTENKEYNRRVEFKLRIN